jgi:hypothetical protein
MESCNQYLFNKSHILSTHHAFKIEKKIKKNSIFPFLNIISFGNLSLILSQVNHNFIINSIMAPRFGTSNWPDIWCLGIDHSQCSGWPNCTG